MNQSEEKKERRFNMIPSLDRDPLEGRKGKILSLGYKKCSIKICTLKLLSSKGSKCKKCSNPIFFDLCSLFFKQLCLTYLRLFWTSPYICILMSIIESLYEDPLIEIIQTSYENSLADKHTKFTAIIFSILPELIDGKVRKMWLFFRTYPKNDFIMYSEIQK